MHDGQRQFTNYFWIPLRDFLKKHYFLTAVMAAFIYLYVQWNKEPEAPPAPAQILAPKLPEAPAAAPKPVTVEDANGAFAKNALATLEENEYRTYGHFFYNMMNTQEGEGLRDWKTQHASGVISASAPFEGAFHSECRRYAERYTVGAVIQQRSGITCKDKKSAAWCKLRATSLPTCELNKNGGMTEFFGDTGVSIHDLQLKTNDILYRLQHLF